MMIAIIIVALTACGAGNTPQQGTTSVQSTGSAQTTQASSTEKTFTAADLATYTGQNGSKAYIAVDGIVYDVTDVPQWQGGVHKKGLTAGKDLTDAFKSSPHDNTIFDGVPVVGKYVK